jgi:subfamily B ATP-binding cassette protein MsbA
LREKVRAVYEAARFRPTLGIAIVILSSGTALLEGIGLGFLLPIVEIARSPTPPADADGALGLFVRAYEFVGLPLTLEWLILGLAGVIGLRFSLSFLTAWLRAILGLSYQSYLRERLFTEVAYGPIEYIDRAGSDALLNGIITETSQAGGIVMAAFDLTETLLRGLVYFALAALLAPGLTVVAIISLGASTLFVRYVLEPAYAVGDEVAEVNDRIQTVTQTSLQGMRDVRLYNMRSELVARMRETLDRYISVGVRFQRNQAALSNLNQLLNALVVFGLVYVGFTFTGLSLSRLGVFLFAIFRLSPVVNQLNTRLYGIEGQLPHLLRVRSRMQELADKRTVDDEGGDSIDTVRRVEFDNVSFRYKKEEERVLQDISFGVERGEKIALVGPSGAGKSTIVSLLGRLQAPDSGTILADGRSIAGLDITDWRERLAVVRQDPFLFDGTLRENVTIGNRDATDSAIERVCDIAQVTEFLPDLPNGYETELGEDGVRLSGGQRQRVAIARALLKDADVLVLDEATSELDSNIEADLYANLTAVEAEYAIVSIAHRLSTVSDADRIYVLADGTVDESGTHRELLADDGVYASLYEANS